MNHRIITTSFSMLLAGIGFAAAQEVIEVESASPPSVQSVPVLKEIPIINRLFVNASGEGAGGSGQVSGGAITFKTESDGKGKATITIDINGKKETREIDLGNATEIKVVTESADAAKPKRVTFFGVAPEELSEELASQLPLDAGTGLLVRSVVPDSPASAVGIQKNDVLVKLDDQFLTAPKQLQKLVASRKPSDTVRITYFRRGQRMEVEAKLAEHEESGNPKLDVFLDSVGVNRTMWQKAPLRIPMDPLSFQKKIVVMDKDGNVVSKDDSEVEQAAAVKRLAAEVDRMRSEAAAAQKQAQEAVRHAEKAAREAAEIAKREAAATAERVKEMLRQIQDQLDKQKPQQ